MDIRSTVPPKNSPTTDTSSVDASVRLSAAFNPYALPPEAVREPPTSLWQTLLMIGPGIVLAGTIVGSGELLVTTGLGATSGYTFLWLILLSCVIKVFVQIELGRYAIASANQRWAHWMKFKLLDSAPIFWSGGGSS